MLGRLVARGSSGTRATALTAGAHLAGRRRRHRPDGGAAAPGAQQLRRPTASYRSAVALIRRLDALSDKLSGGLDAVGIAEQADGSRPTGRSHHAVRPRCSSAHPAARSRRCATPPARRPAPMSWAEDAGGDVLGDASRWCSTRAAVALPLRGRRRGGRRARPRGRAAPSTRRAARPARPARHARRAAPGRAALRPGPRLRHQPGAPADRPRGARRRRPGRRLARLPRRQHRRHIADPIQQRAGRPAARGGDPRGRRPAALDLRPAPGDPRPAPGLGESLSAYAHQVAATSPWRCT